MFETDGDDGGDDRQRSEQDEEPEVVACVAALVLIHDYFDNFTLGFIIDPLSVFLLEFDALHDLLLLLIEAPDVLDRRLLALPRLNVEDRPE